MSRAQRIRKKQQSLKSEKRRPFGDFSVVLVVNALVSISEVTLHRPVYYLYK